MQLREYQAEIVEKALRILQLLKIVYLSMEVRTGKTLTALSTAERYGARKVLLVTKKKAMDSIRKDYEEAKPEFALTIVNFEGLHKVTGRFDLVIIDEAHSLGAFPKPSGRTKKVKELIGLLPIILMSGTPNPESFSQLYHQFWVSVYSPFKNPNFYSFAKEFVDVKERIYNGRPIRDYSRANEAKIRQFTDPYFISCSQKEAGFQSEIVEQICHVPMQDYTYKLVERLIRDRYYKLKSGGEIVCDTAVKLKAKIHQLFSGTIKCEDGSRHVLDFSKVTYIRDHYEGKKLAIFYKFIAEGEALKMFFRDWTDSPEEFNNSLFKTFICQIQSGSMGTNLSSADVVIFYNIDFSSLMYWQARARMMTKDRLAECPVHWIFSEGGIEDKIYKRVIKKKEYTNAYFKKDYLCQNSSYKRSA